MWRRSRGLVVNENWTRRKELPMAVIDQDGIVWVLLEADQPAYTRPRLGGKLAAVHLEELHGPCTPMIAEAGEEDE